MSRPLRILLSNDDGIHAPGILAMKIALAAEGFSVTVCAPDRPRSASGHAITLHKPLRVQPTSLADGSPALACSGMPSDCVLMGIAQFPPAPGERFDLVVSGINHGPNLGWDVTYSGTVAAAMEAVIADIPAIAVSMASYDPAPHWDTAADFVARHLVRATVERGLPTATLLNVNVPNLPADQLDGIEVTTQGERHYRDRHEARVDPHGAPYYWLGGVPEEGVPVAGTDIAAVRAGRISVTPIHLDLTNREHVAELRGWGIETRSRLPVGS